MSTGAAQSRRSLHSGFRGEAHGCERAIERIRITLPAVPKRVASYLPYRLAGKLLFLSSQGLRDEKGNALSATNSGRTSRLLESPAWKSILKEGSELPRSARVLELSDRLGLDLSNALTCNRKLLAHFLQGVIAVHAEPKAHAYDALLARRQ